MIKIENLIYEYRKNEAESICAIDNLTLEIEKGSFTVIIGQNGSGKSTVAKNINALVYPTSGDVFVKKMNTKDPEFLWEIRQLAGMVFQNPDNQMVSSIVEDDVAFGPENLGVPPAEIRKRVDESLQAIGMEAYKSKGPHMLSGGQKQRVAIAGIVAMLPECIILDEPTAMLDPQGRKEVMDIIRKLNKEKNITIILITHFMEEATLADRVILMDKGKISLDGTPEMVFSKRNEIKALGMEVPLVAELVYQLKEKGCSLPPNILTIEDLVACL